MDVKTIIK